MENNKIFCDKQFGFRSGISTGDAINHFVDYVIEGFEQREYVNGLFCDLTKAFDCVPHNILIEKLKYYNFNTNSIQLMQNYLTNRTQYVEINGCKSAVKNIVSGVPQGSVLGPVLFLIFINDLGGAVPGAGLILFADDTTIITKNKDLSLLREEMDRAQSLARNWFVSNGLCLHENKTNNVVFTKRYCPEQVNTKPVLFLGVTLDSNLNWSNHIENVSNISGSNDKLINDK